MTDAPACCHHPSHHVCFLISEMIIGPLIKGHEMEPCWQCWLKHLEYLTIITQHVITEAELTTVARLISDHQQAFAKVPEYEGLDKPKHHMASHVVRDIRNNGPPRAFWCLGFEAYNKIIKGMFTRSNYKSSTVSVAKFWCASTARSLRRGEAGAWFEDVVCASSELKEVNHTVQQGVLMTAACTTDVISVQHLHSFSRGSVNIKTGSWVHVQSADPREEFDAICQISEMCQIFTHDACYIRMMTCQSVKRPSVQQGIWMNVPSCDMVGDCMMIKAESAILSELHAVRDDVSYNFRYVW